MKTSKAFDDAYANQVSSKSFESSGRKLKSLLLSDIEGSFSDRPFSGGDVDALSGSIKDVGVLHPPVVEQIEDGKYKVVAGSRRIKACQELGMKEVECVVRSDLSELERCQIKFQENARRKNFSALERALLLQDFHQSVMAEEDVGNKEGWDRVGAICGLGERQIKNVRRVLDLPLDIRAAVKSSEDEGFSFTERHIREIARLDSVSEQKSFITDIKEEKLSSVEVKKRVDELLEVPKKVVFKYSSQAELLKQLRAKLAELEACMEASEDGDMVLQEGGEEEASPGTPGEVLEDGGAVALSDEFAEPAKGSAGKCSLKEWEKILVSVAGTFPLGGTDKEIGDLCDKKRMTIRNTLIDKKRKFVDTGSKPRRFHLNVKGFEHLSDHEFFSEHRDVLEAIGSLGGAPLPDIADKEGLDADAIKGALDVYLDCNFVLLDKEGKYFLTPAGECLLEPSKAGKGGAS